MHRSLATSSWHELPAWFASPLGERLLAEQAPHLAEIARRFHGDTLLWAGCQTPLTETVRGCMVRNRLYTLCSAPPKAANAEEGDEERAFFQCELHALPLANGSLDAMVVHHGLEAADDPRTAVREIARVLRPGGRLVICGFNPLSLWGLRNLFGRVSQDGLKFVRPARILDWLTVLGFELSDDVLYLAYGLPFFHGPAKSATLPDTARWHPLHWVRQVRGVVHRHQPPFGGVYMIVAFKQAAAVRPDVNALKARPGKLAPVAYPKLSTWNRVERSG